MPNSYLDLLKNLVSDRLKHVDGLVRDKKIDEAVREISEIRKLDIKNPYALAYEERILALQQSMRLQQEREPINQAPPPPEPLIEPTPSTMDVEHPPDPPVEPSPIQVSSDERYRISPGMPVSQVEDSSAQAPIIHKRESKGKASVVLVDDDVMLLQALTEFLEDNKFSTKTFTRAEEALNYLKDQSPDLIICDVNLETSTFGGFTLHEKMRKMEHLRDVPFIFLSGLNDTAIVLAGKELGADDYLTKPVEPEALLAVVKGKLKRYRQIKKNS